MTPYVAPFTAGAPVMIDGARPAVYLAPETRTMSRVRLVPSGALAVVRDARLISVAAGLGYDLAERAAEVRASRTRALVRDNLAAEVDALQPVQAELPL